MTVEIAIEVVTPELAAKWLATQHENRSLRRNQVTQWANDMLRGDFPAIVQPIMFDEEGRLIDGQHRLNAVIESGVTIPMYVARGVPLEHRRYIDGGTSRSAGDVLHMDYKMANRTHLAAIASAVLMYRDHPEKQWNGKLRPGKQLIIDEVVSDPDAYQTAVLCGEAATRSTPAGLWLTRSAYGTLNILVNRMSSFQDQWDQFHEGVSTGANLDKGDPRLALRSAAVNGPKSRMQYSLMACLKTWNAYVQGRELRLLRVGSPNYLPMPEVI